MSLNNYNEVNNNIKELCNYHNVETKRLSNIIDKNFSDDWDSKMLMALKLKQSDFKDLSHLKDWGRDVHNISNNISNPMCHPGIKYHDIISEKFLKT